jgi:CRP/FNR family transcriptional regulator, cyclic AMP receptor protein
MEGTTTITTLEPILKEHPFLTNLEPDKLHFIVECASNVRFNAGEYLFREGEAANHFYLIRKGRVVLEIPSPNRPSICLETLGEGEMLGWSWFFPPYRWHFDAHAVELTLAIAFDAQCVRRKCDIDHGLGYRLARQFAAVQADRLEATLIRLVDIHGG